MINGVEKLGRVSPAALPAEVKALAYVFLAGGMQSIVYFAFQAVIFFTRRTWESESYFVSNEKFTAVIALLMVIGSIGLLRVSPWARKAMPFILLIAGWARVTAVIHYGWVRFFTAYSSGERAIGLVQTGAQLIAIALFYGLFIYLLTRQHVRQAFGETIKTAPATEPVPIGAAPPQAAAEEQGEDVKYVMSALAGLEQWASWVYPRIFRNMPLVIAVIIAFLLKDGLQGIGSWMDPLIGIINASFGGGSAYDSTIGRTGVGMSGQLMVVAMVIIGALGVIAGIGMLRRASWGKGLAVAFLAVSCIKWLLQVLLLKSGIIQVDPTQWWTDALECALAGIIMACVYIALLTMLNKAQTLQEERSVQML